MSSQKEKVERSRLRSSYFSVIMSISLVLFLLGVLGVLLLNAHSVSTHLKENFTFTALLKEDAKTTDVKQLQKTLELADYIKSTNYISKEASATQLKKELGEDFINFIGHNPLPDALDIKLNAAYVSPESLQKIEKELLAKTFVAEVIYDKPLIEQMTENIEKITFGMLVFCGVFVLIAVVLISSSIRLAVYSKRFTIKTMQLVGATKSFIRKPFILLSIKHGVIGAALALSALSGLIVYLQETIPGFSGFDQIELMVVLYTTILLVAVLIAWLSTVMSLNRFLRLTTEELYD